MFTEGRGVFPVSPKRFSKSNVDKDGNIDFNSLDSNCPVSQFAPDDRS